MRLAGFIPDRHIFAGARHVTGDAISGLVGILGRFVVALGYFNIKARGCY
jgi:hypothetical protein